MTNESFTVYEHSERAADTGELLYLVFARNPIPYSAIWCSMLIRSSELDQLISILTQQRKELEG